MTKNEMKELFMKFDKEEFHKFDRVAEKLSKYREINALLLLSKYKQIHENRAICSIENGFMVLSADVNCMENISEEEILTLVRCGVVYSDNCYYYADCLIMFV